MEELMNNASSEDWNEFGFVIVIIRSNIANGKKR